MKRITLKRIYQGCVSNVQIPTGNTANPWQPLDDWKSALWQHHQLFQDAVNYYSVCLAALAENSTGWAGEYSSQVQKKWDIFIKKGDKRHGLRKSLARTLSISEGEASLKTCAKRVLQGCEASKEELHLLVQELFPEKKGHGTIQHAGTGDWPMLCWKDWDGESKSEKKLRKESGRSTFLAALFGCEQELAANFAGAFSLGQSALISLAKGHSDLSGEKARHKLEVSVETLAKQLKDASFQKVFRKHSRLSQSGIEDALNSLKSEIQDRGASFTTSPWTGGNKDMTPIQLFLLFKFAPTNPLTMPALKSCLRKQHISLLRRTVKPFTLSNLKQFMRTSPSGSPAGAKPATDAIRAARGKRGFAFPAFTAISGWGAQPGEFAWKNFDMAAFEEALKSPHQIRQKNQDRQKERAEALETLRLMDGGGKVRRASDSDEVENIPGFKGDERITALRRIVETDLVDENVAAGGEYGIQERTLRGYGELRRLWNEKVQPGEPYSKEKHDKLAKILRDYQTEHRDDSGDVKLFAELLKQANWCIWQTPTPDEATEQANLNHSNDPLRDFQHYLELRADIERLNKEIEFTPADPQHSRRQFYFSEGEKFSTQGQYTHERNALAFTTRIVVKENGLWKPVRVRISYTAPRLRRDALRQDSGEKLESTHWLAPLLQGLGISQPKELQDFSCCAVSLMPDWHDARPKPDSPPNAMLLNFPVDLECIELQRAIHDSRNQRGEKFFKTRENPKTKNEEPQSIWDYQFGGRKEGTKFAPMWLSWPDEGRDVREFGAWYNTLSSFRTLATDLGQRDAGAFARLLASCENAVAQRPSRFIGKTGDKEWRATLERSGLFRLPGEDALVWRARTLPSENRPSPDDRNKDDTNLGLDYREELWGERGRPARSWEADETAELMSRLEVPTDDKQLSLLSDNWRDKLSFPEQNDKLLIALRRYQSRIARLHRWCWFLKSEEKQQKSAFEEIAECEDTRLISAQQREAATKRDPRLLEQLETQLRDRLKLAPKLLLRIANRVLPLRGRSWHWEKHSLATDESPIHQLTQCGPNLDSLERPVWLRGQRGLSLERIEQIEELRKRFQSLNQTLRRKIGGKPPIRRDESVPDPCPDLLDKLDNLKEQRVNQTAHLILAEALGLRLAPPPADKKKLRQEKDQHGVYEKILDKHGNWVGPVDFIVIEDLSRYRATQGRAPRENSRLMKWCHRAVRDKLKQLCEVFGLPVLETPAAYSSRFCSRSGVPGFRVAEVTAGFTKSGQWAWLAGKKDENGNPKEEAQRLLNLDQQLTAAQAELERDWREKRRPGECLQRTLFVPSSGGPVFVPVVGKTTGSDLQPAVAQADINAAINLALRAIADPQVWSIHSRLRTQRDKKDGSLAAREKRKFGEKNPPKLTVTAVEELIKDSANPNFFADFAGLVDLAGELGLVWLNKEWTSAALPGDKSTPLPLLHSKSFWGTVKAAQWKRIEAINTNRLTEWKNKLTPMPD